MLALIPYNPTSDQTQVVKWALTQEEFAHTILRDTFINVPFSTELTITNANTHLCGGGLIAQSLGGKPLSIITQLFESSILPFTSKFKIEAAEPIKINFGSDGSSYTLSSSTGLRILRDYVSLPISITQIGEKLTDKHLPDLPDFQTKQILWFQDLPHHFLNEASDDELKKRINEAINGMMPSSHTFKLKFNEEETTIIRQMSGTKPDGVIVKSDRLMSIRIVPKETINT